MPPAPLSGIQISMDESFFKHNALTMGISLSNEQMEQFNLYRQELLVWNTKINLISEKSAQEVDSRHFLDSLTALRFIDKENARVLDIGSGAGFPGLPLKIARPTLELYLMESNRKKASFLKHIIRKLQLEKTIVSHCRAEDMLKQNNWHEYFDIVISRAAFRLSEFISFSVFFLAEGGKFIALKGDNSENEFVLCAKDKNVSVLFELFQYDTVEYFTEKRRKIVVGKKLKKEKKIF